MAAVSNSQAITIAPSASESRMKPNTLALSNDQARIIKNYIDKATPPIYKGYQLSFSPDNKVNAALWIPACVSTGALAGAAIGSCCAGFGAGPGALTGAGVGLIVGVLTLPTFTYASDYASWKLSNSAAAKGLMERVRQLAKVQNGEFFCPMSCEIPIHPVTTPYTTQVYEREFLEAHVKSRGTCPLTSRPMKLSDIRVSMGGMAAANSIASQVLATEAIKQTFKPEYLEGLKRMQSAARNNMKQCLKLEFQRMTSLLDSESMSIEQIHEQTGKLIDVKNLKVQLDF
jgi:hypothetical protein